MSTSTVERQMEILEQIHALRRELQELAGDALVVTVEPAGKNGKPKAAPSRPRRRPARAANGGQRPATRDAGREHRVAVMDVFKERPNDWIAAAEIVELTGISRPAITRAMRQLREQGAVEHNGERTHKARYRLHAGALPDEGWPHTFRETGPIITPPRDEPELDDDLQGLADDDGHPDEDALGPDEAPPGEGPPPDRILPASPGPHHRPVSPRVQKSVERAEREASAPSTNGAGDKAFLTARIKTALAQESQTLRELAATLDVEISDVSVAVAQLRESGAVVKCGVRMPRRDQVYGVPGAE